MNLSREIMKIAAALDKNKSDKNKLEQNLSSLVSTLQKDLNKLSDVTRGIDLEKLSEVAYKFINEVMSWLNYSDFLFENYEPYNWGKMQAFSEYVKRYKREFYIKVVNRCRGRLEFCKQESDQLALKSVLEPVKSVYGDLDKIVDILGKLGL